MREIITGVGGREAEKKKVGGGEREIKKGRGNFNARAANNADPHVVPYCVSPFGLGDFEKDNNNFHFANLRLYSTLLCLIVNWNLSLSYLRFYILLILSK